jgi:hypothetical protein
VVQKVLIFRVMGTGPGLPAPSRRAASILSIARSSDNSSSRMSLSLSRMCFDIVFRLHAETATETAAPIGPLAHRQMFCTERSSILLQSSLRRLRISAAGNIAKGGSLVFLCSDFVRNSDDLTVSRFSCQTLTYPNAEIEGKAGTCSHFLETP